jgi:hypothetical protein
VGCGGKFSDFTPGVGLPASLFFDEAAAFHVFFAMKE